MRGVYPGSFNPPTRAHLAIIEAAIDQHELESLDLVLSQVALAKETVNRPHIEHRSEVIQASVEHLTIVRVVVTHHQLLADISTGYDVLIMGADKWLQIQDPVFYDDSAAQRDVAMAALPRVAIAPRLGLDIPGEHILDVPDWAADISSSAARAGETHQMTAAALAFDQDTGAWSDPARYDNLHG